MDTPSPLHHLDQYLAHCIPLTQAMGIKLARFDAQGLSLSAPLAPNVNDKGTAFAGAIATLLTLSGWALTQLTLEQHGLTGQAVVADSQIEYLRPANGDLSSDCRLPAAEEVTRFIQRFQERGRASWHLEVSLYSQGQCVAKLRGRYVGYQA